MTGATTVQGVIVSAATTQAQSCAIAREMADTLHCLELVYAESDIGECRLMLVPRGATGLQRVTEPRCTAPVVHSVAGLTAEVNALLHISYPLEWGGCFVITDSREHMMTVINGQVCTVPVNNDSMFGAPVGPAALPASPHILKEDADTVPHPQSDADEHGGVVRLFGLDGEQQRIDVQAFHVQGSSIHMTLTDHTRLVVFPMNEGIVRVQYTERDGNGALPCEPPTAPMRQRGRRGGRARTRW